MPWHAVAQTKQSRKRERKVDKKSLRARDRKKFNICRLINLCTWYMFVQLFILPSLLFFAVKWPAHDVNRAIRRAVAVVRQTSRSIQVRVVKVISILRDTNRPHLASRCSSRASAPTRDGRVLERRRRCSSTTEPSDAGVAAPTPQHAPWALHVAGRERRADFGF